MDKIKQLTEKQAIAFFELELWKHMSLEERFRFQLFQERLCMPFDKFHEAAEFVLNRSVFTHEFAFYDHIVAEYLGKKPAPSFDEIINLIPVEKRLVLEID